MQGPVSSSYQATHQPLARHKDPSIGAPARTRAAKRAKAELRGKQGEHLDLTPVLTADDFDNFPSLKDWGFTAEEVESIKQAYVGQPLPLRKGFKLPELTTTQERDDWAETYISNILSVW